MTEKTNDASHVADLFVKEVANGQTEVVNRTSDNMLRTVLKGKLTSWEDHLPLVGFDYNGTVHSSTWSSPFAVVYGFNPLVPLI